MVEKLKNRKGQEEIAGFVLIVVLVAIIFLVLLGLFIKGSGKDSMQNSNNVRQFLESSMEYTSDCAINEPNYLTLGELIAKCKASSGSLCANDENVCKAANRTISSLLDAGWLISKDGNYKGYQFTSAMNQSSVMKPFIQISRGNCTSKFVGHYYTIGDITSSLKICL